MTDWSKTYRMLGVNFTIHYRIYEPILGSTGLVVSNSMINYSYSFNRNNMNASEIENHTIEHFTAVCERRYKNKGYSNFSDYVNNHSREDNRRWEIGNTRDFVLVENMDNDDNKIMIGYIVKS